MCIGIITECYSRICKKFTIIITTTTAVLLSYNTKCQSKFIYEYHLSNFKINYYYIFMKQSIHFISTAYTCVFYEHLPENLHTTYLFFCYSSEITQCVVTRNILLQIIRTIAIRCTFCLDKHRTPFILSGCQPDTGKFVG